MSEARRLSDLILNPPPPPTMDQLAASLGITVDQLRENGRRYRNWILRGDPNRD